ncbi:MAG: DUF2192 domain-containing protein [Desulfurococcales archaeon]|nr:DUF2192 domain-containing protein [Desulfurococcales archaeon]
MEKNEKQGSNVRKRISLLTDLWGLLLDEYRETVNSREDVISILEKRYHMEGLSPIKGKATPPDIYEKELVALYVVGKYGMHLDEEFPEIFEDLFCFELKLDKALDYLLNKSPSKARGFIEKSFEEVSMNLLSKIFRVAVVKELFGMAVEEEVARTFKNSVKAFPELEPSIRKYLRFYIAVRVANAISRGEIRDRLTKEAYKQALAVRLGWDKTVIPDDAYVGHIAVEVFSVSKKIVSHILRT